MLTRVSHVTDNVEEFPFLFVSSSNALFEVQSTMKVYSINWSVSVVDKRMGGGAKYLCDVVSHEQPFENLE